MWFHETAAKFRERAFTVKSLTEQTHSTQHGPQLRKVLGAFDLVMFGIGGILGAGVFVLTGVAAHNNAGPAVTVSYALAGGAAMIAALCYAEYAVECPLAGGAFNFINLTFGEFAAWVVACDLILEYTLSAAAVAKGFTAYLAALIGVEPSRLHYSYSFFTIDGLALLAVILLSLVLMKGISESTLVNIIINVINLLLIVFILIAGFLHVDAENYKPFAPFGLRGIFGGAAVVFFSFIGFDTVATVSEEVRNPGRDLPIGIVGSLAICTSLYVMMCLVITGMESAATIDVHAPFAVAFMRVGMHWAQRIVASGALTGIVTSLLTSLLGQTRIYVTLGRARLLPPWMAVIHPRTNSPIHAGLVTAVTAGTLALLFNIEILAELVSIGTLVVFMMVAMGVLARRYYIAGSGAPITPLAWRMGGLGLSSIGFSINFTEGGPWALGVIFMVCWFAITVSFLLLPIKYVPSTFKVPWFPFLPCAGVFTCLFLIGSLGWPAYVRWIVWFTLGTCVYLCYGVHQPRGPMEDLLASGHTQSGSFDGDGRQLLPGDVAMSHVLSHDIELTHSSGTPQHRATLGTKDKTDSLKDLFRADGSASSTPTRGYVDVDLNTPFVIEDEFTERTRRDAISDRCQK